VHVVYQVAAAEANHFTAPFISKIARSPYLSLRLSVSISVRGNIMLTQLWIQKGTLKIPAEAAV
jgi:hypothetical protein